MNRRPSGTRSGRSSRRLEVHFRPITRTAINTPSEETTQSAERDPEAVRRVLPGQPGEVHAEQAGDEGRRQEGRGQCRERIELAVGLGGELGVDLVVKEAGARFEHLEILIEIVEPRCEAVKAFREIRNGAVGEQQGAAHGAHMPVQHRRLAAQQHEPAALAAVAFVENVVLDDFHLVEQFMHRRVELVGELRNERDEKISGRGKASRRAAMRRRICSADCTARLRPVITKRAPRMKFSAGGLGRIGIEFAPEIGKKAEKNAVLADERPGAARAR